jgi:hypothetical protein
MQTVKTTKIWCYESHQIRISASWLVLNHIRVLTQHLERVHTILPEMTTAENNTPKSKPCNRHYNATMLAMESPG